MLPVAVRVSQACIFMTCAVCAATNLRRAGVDTVTAMKIVGHKSEKMHRRYNSVNEHDLTTAAGKLNTYLIAASNTLITPTLDSGLVASDFRQD